MLLNIFHLPVQLILFLFFFFFNDTATPEIYTLSLHDALPISESRFPLLCLGVTAFVCSRLVTAMTGWPSALARTARPTIDPLTPEFDAIRKTSADSKVYSP